MRKSLILALTALGSGASYGAGVSELGTEAPQTDPAVWRWHVNAILADQNAPRPIPSHTARFDHLYQRYTTLGLPQR